MSEKTGVKKVGLFLFLGLSRSIAWAAPLEPSLSALLVAQGQVWSRAASMALVKQVMADGQCTPQEFELLQRLAGAGETPLTIDGVAVARPTGEGLEIFQLVTQPQDLLARWTGGSKQMQGLLDLTEISPQYAAQLQAVVVQQLVQIYRRPEGTAANQHEPLRCEIKRAYSVMNALPAESRRRGLAILYRACLAADRATNQEMPDYLYDWLKNPPPSEN